MLFRSHKGEIAGNPRKVGLQVQSPTACYDVFAIEQDMDYKAEPRPKIVGYRIRMMTAMWKMQDVAAEECEVEIEDVTEGDAALRGEWIRSVKWKRAVEVESAEEGEKAGG